MLKSLSVRPLIAGVAALTVLAPMASTAHAAPATAQVDRVVVNPREDASTGMSVSFRAPGAVGEVEYAAPGGELVRVPAGLVLSRLGGGAEPIMPPGPLPVAEHFAAHLTGLQPATTYTYRPIVDGVPGEWAEFTTASATSEPFSFVYYGDAQTHLDSVWPKVAARALEHSPDAALTVHSGDQIDNPHADVEWHDFFAGMQGTMATRPSIVAPGNHELMLDPFAYLHRAHFEFPNNGVDGLPDTTFFNDYQGVRFITLHVNYIRLGEQAAWLDRVLADNPHQWAVVNFHEPVWNATSRRDEPFHRDAFRGVIEKHNVDLVLTGHDHAYARGHQAGNPNGPAYAVTVAGGKYYDVDLAGDPWSLSGGKRVVGAGGISTFQRIDVDGCRMDYTSIIGHVSEKATQPATEGDVLDAFSIDKCDGDKKVIETRSGA